MSSHGNDKAHQVLGPLVRQQPHGDYVSAESQFLLRKSELLMPTRNNDYYCWDQSREGANIRRMRRGYNGLDVYPGWLASPALTGALFYFPNRSL